MAIWVILITFGITAAALIWEVEMKRSENLDLRLQNERLIARIAHEYHFAAARPGPPPSIPDTPTPAPMWSNRPRIRPYIPSPLPPSER